MTSLHGFDNFAELVATVAQEARDAETSKPTPLQDILVKRIYSRDDIETARYGETDTVAWFEENAVKINMVSKMTQYARGGFSFYRRYIDGTRVIQVTHTGDLADDVNSSRIVVYALMVRDP